MLHIFGQVNKNDTVVIIGRSAFEQKIENNEGKIEEIKENQVVANKKRSKNEKDNHYIISSANDRKYIWTGL